MSYLQTVLRDLPAEAAGRAGCGVAGCGVARGWNGLTDSQRGPR